MSQTHQADMRCGCKYFFKKIFYLVLQHKSIETEIKISSETEFDSKNLKKLKDLCTSPVIVYEKSGKRSEKKIFKLEYFQESENELTLLIDVEGGLPIKRFVNGDDVNPSIANTLETPCECAEFDILDVTLQ